MESKKCEYGCGQKAKYFLKSVKKWCCSKYATQCPELRKKNSKALKKIWTKNEHGLRKFTKDDLRKSHITYRKNLQEKYSKMEFKDLPRSEKRRRILFEQNFKCIICGLENWMNKPITLHMDHIDGNKNNEVRQNLRLVCPNCHSQTKTYCMAKKYLGE